MSLSDSELGRATYTVQERMAAALGAPSQTALRAAVHERGDHGAHFDDSGIRALFSGHDLDLADVDELSTSIAARATIDIIHGKVDAYTALRGTVAQVLAIGLTLADQRSAT